MKGDRVQGTMKIMDPVAGDEEVTWDPEDEKSIEKAKTKFDKAVKAGKRAFKVVESTVRQKGEQVTKFDPSHTQGYIVAAPLAGG